jgi:hypothetical protein
MSMFMLVSANDSSILQSTTYIFTPFVFGNTVCSQLTTNIHNRVFVMSMFMLLSANDSSILQSTAYIFTPFAFGNTVCSQLTTNIH